MKKLLALLIVVLSFVSFQQAIIAEGPDDEYWNTLDRGQAVIEIPNGITSIPDNAFEGKTTLTSISIPDSVTIIGKSAFKNCENLSQVNIPNNVSEIASSTFYGCKSLTDIVIPDSVTEIGATAFYKCPGLTSLTLPISVKIKTNSFDFLDGLPNLSDVRFTPGENGVGFDYVDELYKTGEFVQFTPWRNSKADSMTVTFDEGIKYIGNNILLDCTNVTSLTIPDSIEGIGESCFKNCTKIASLTLPITLSFTNGDSLFSSGIELKNIRFTKGFGDPINYNQYDYDKTPWYKGRNSLTFITFDEGIKTIGSYMFKDQSSFSTFSLPDSIEHIGNNAFDNCTSLTSFTVPRSTISIGNSVFNNCQNLTSLSTNPNNNHFDSRNNCNAIIETSTNILVLGCKNTVIPNDVVSIGDGSFYGIKGFSSIIIPNSVLSIGCSAFEQCTDLTSIVIPNSVTTIGDSAFYNCTKLETVALPKELESIEDYLFLNCSKLVNVTIPSNISSIGISAFEGCSSLKTAIIPNTVTFVSEKAFSNCTNLETLTISEAIEELSIQTFANCTNITSLTIPISVKLKSNTFTGVSNITNLHITKGTGIGKDFTTKNVSGNYYLSFAPWYNSREKLTTLTFDDGITYIGNCGFYGLSKITSLTIPDSVTGIGSEAFYDCLGLKTLSLSNNLTSIGYSAFYNCSGISSIVIPDSVTKIENSTFYNCSSVTSLTLPNALTTIGEWAFYKCKEQTLVIPDTVTRISIEAFGENNNITSLTMPISASIETNSIYDCSNIKTLHFTKGTGIGMDYNEPLYFQTPWYKSRNTLTTLILDEGITKIGDRTFFELLKVTSLTLPSTIETIGEQAFNGCDSINLVIIPDSVTSIGDYAFESCDSLLNAFIPGTCTTISNNAFANNTNCDIYVDAPSDLAGWSSNWHDAAKSVTYNTSKDDFYDHIQYCFTEGDGQEVYNNVLENLVFKCGAPLEELITVKVDDVVINENTDYSKESGSTIITLLKPYLETLSFGTHTLELTYNNGSKPKATFTIIKSTTPPSNSGGRKKYIIPNTGIE